MKRVSKRFKKRINYKNKNLKGGANNSANITLGLDIVIELINLLLKYKTYWDKGKLTIYLPVLHLDY